MGWASLREKCNRVALDRLGSVGITAGGFSGRGMRSEESQLVLGETTISLDLMITAEAKYFRTLTYGDTAIVSGLNYIVIHEPIVIGDGTWCRIPLQAATLAPEPVITLLLTTTTGTQLTTTTGIPLLAI